MTDEIVERTLDRPIAMPGPIPPAMPAALSWVGFGFCVSYLADLVEAWPPQFQNIGWQILFLERLFVAGAIPVLGVLGLLLGVWFGDRLRGSKSKVRSTLIGLFSLALGAGILLAIPLYTQNLSRIHQMQKLEILNTRQAQNPLPGSELAEKYDAVLKQQSQSYFNKLLRFDTNAAAIGTVLVVLGILGIRYTREREGVGFCCPTCESPNIRQASMQKDERSLALFTRLHTFRCTSCGHRFRRFSLTGKPYTFL